MPHKKSKKNFHATFAKTNVHKGVEPADNHYHAGHPKSYTPSYMREVRRIEFDTYVYAGSTSHAAFCKPREMRALDSETDNAVFGNGKNKPIAQAYI